MKLIARAIKTEKEFTATVEPTVIEKGDYFDYVNDAFNSVAFHGNHIGDLKFYGQGAGKLATGDAVLRDIIDALTNRYTKEKVQQENLTRKNNNHTHRASYYIRSDQPISSDYIEQDGVYISEMADTNRTLLEKELKKIDAKEYFIAKISRG